MIDQRLVNDSVFICDFDLSQLRLMKDGELDWFILVPKRDGIVEWIDLALDDQIKLTQEIDFITRILKTNLHPTKINIATIGNIVRQFHLHIVARYDGDRAWPKTIWGTQSTKEFDESKVSFWKNAIEENVDSFTQLV